jgi:succinyl-CoA synthetase beta subunit
MRLLEFEAKSLLAASAIPVPRSFIVSSAKPAFLPVVVKSQVPVGGRGKAGGVAIAQSATDYKKSVAHIEKLVIKGHAPNKLLAEELIDIKHEYYLSLSINKQTAAIQLLAHICGGMEVEENDSNFLELFVTQKNLTIVGEQLAEHFELPEKSFLLQELLEKLYDCFTKNDATLLEINPLILTPSGEIIAGDCKMKLDGNAAFRHNDWQFEAGESDANFVTLDEHGDIATIANGAGLAMATVDAVASAGFHPANFLDVGGGASEASVLAAFRRIMRYSHVKVIVINIFAGITRCDEIAKAIIAAKNQIPNLPPLSIRLAGTNFDQAAALLEAESIPTLATLEECIANAKEHLA